MRKNPPSNENHFQTSIARKVSSSVLISLLEVTTEFPSFLISYSVFEFHSDIQDSAGRRTLSFLLSHAQLTTATRYTLSYICSRGLTRIYTRREEIPEEPSGDEIKIAGTTGGTLGRTLEKKPNVRWRTKRAGRHTPRLILHTSYLIPGVYVLARWCPLHGSVYRVSVNKDGRDPHNS